MEVALAPRPRGLHIASSDGPWGPYRPRAHAKTDDPKGPGVVGLPRMDKAPYVCRTSVRPNVLIFE